jgi:hypothetical protein
MIIGFPGRGAGAHSPNRGAEQQSPRADAARIANAKISRRKSLKKQRQAQKVSGDGLHPDEEK